MKPLWGWLASALPLTKGNNRSAGWLRVIQINDVYSLASFPNLKTLIDQNKPTKEDEGPDTFCVVCAGDFLSPSLLSSLDHGTAMVDVLNLVGCTHVCLGNHEADVPAHALSQRMQQSDFVWLNSNILGLEQSLGVRTPVCEVLHVKCHQENKGSQDAEKRRGRRVALVGLLTEDPSLYRPDAFCGASILPVMDTAQSLVEQCANIDLILPLTHQNMEEDRHMAQHFGGDTFPLILGGHDHTVFDEIHNGTRVIKTGMDAEFAAIIDIQWRAEEEQPSIHVELKATADFAPDATVVERIRCHEKILDRLEEARLFTIADWVGTPVVQPNEDPPTSSRLFSTRNNRWGPSTGTSALCSMLRMGLRCQVAILGAGSVRANKDYDISSTFSWSDLKTEMTFGTEMTVCYIPGRILQEMITNSRRLAKEGIAHGCYLHASRNVHFDGGESDTIASIMGELFDPDRDYLTGLPLQYFRGLDNHVPLLDWAKESKNAATLMDEEAAKPAKLVLVELFYSLLWLRLGAFNTLSRGNAHITKEDIQLRLMELYGDQGVADLMLDNVFSVADLNGSGSISALEQMIVHFVATDMLDHVATDEEMEVLKDVASRVLSDNKISPDEVAYAAIQARNKLDLLGTGTLQREEMLRALGEVGNRHLLE